MIRFPPHRDPFRILGVSRTAGTDAIESAYRAMVRRFPPQREPERFKEVREAYERLSDPAARAEALLFTLDPPEDGAAPRLDARRLRALVLDALAGLAGREVGLDAHSSEEKP
ncbi:MAG: DnaJ domain-containing protein [Candidatus Riflebacteria bacterium]|nr:DnaJ domain-containing protein [Candidatus Riflebacteria bacterium]